MRRRFTSRIRAGFGERRVAVLAGAATGLFSLAAFGAAHAITITPIWWRLAGGLPFVLIGGAANGWAYHELGRARGRAPTVASGIAYGCLIWATLLPATATAALIRHTGLRPRLGDIDTAIAVTLALLSGGLAGWLLAHTRRAALATATATLAIMIVQGGPIAIFVEARSAHLFLALLAVYAGCGAVLTATIRATTAWRSHQDRPTPPLPQPGSKTNRTPPDHPPS